MTTTYRIELLSWEDREKELENYTKEGWEPLAISNSETFRSYHGAILILLKKEEKQK